MNDRRTSSVHLARAVLFDAVGTLFHSRDSIGEIYSEIAALHGVDADASVLDERFRSLTTRHGAPADKAGWQNLVRQIFVGFDGFGDFARFFEDLYARFRSGRQWRLYPETRSVLESLKQRSVRLGVVTSFDNRVIQVLGELEIAKFFDAIQTSETSSFRKPDRRFLLEAAARLGADPADTLVVGDDPVQDMAAAHSAGMQALLVDRRPSRPHASFLVSSLTEVLSHVAPAGDAGSARDSELSDRA